MALVNFIERKWYFSDCSSIPIDFEFSIKSHWTFLFWKRMNWSGKRERKIRNHLETELLTVQMKFDHSFALKRISWPHHENFCSFNHLHRMAKSNIVWKKKNRLFGENFWMSTTEKREKETIKKIENRFFFFFSSIEYGYQAASTDSVGYSCCNSIKKSIFWYQIYLYVHIHKNKQ